MNVNKREKYANAAIAANIADLVMIATLAKTGMGTCFGSKKRSFFIIRLIFFVKDV